MAPSQARPPVDLAAANWAARIDSMVGAGVKKKVIRQKVVPIMEEDLKSVAQGGQAMPEDAAVLGVQSSLAGRPVLQKEEKSGWSPDDLLGDLTKEIGDLTWRGVPALAKYAWNFDKHLAATAEVMSKGTSPEDTRWLRRHGYEKNDKITMENLLDPEIWSRGVRNVAKTPVLGIIPGVNTAANLTTPKGRMHMAHHPLTTVLDVLPYAQAVSKGAGLAAKAGAVEGSAAEAALQMKPVKAVYRTLPKEIRASVGTKTLAGLRKVGLDPESFGLARGMDQESRKARAAFQQKIKDSGIIEDIAKLPDQERSLLTQEAAFPDQYTPTPEHQSLLDRISQFNDELAIENPELVKIPRTSEVTPPEKPFVMPEFIKNKVTGELEPVGAVKTDASGTPNEQLGVDPQGRSPGQRALDPEQQAIEDAMLAEHRATREPEYVRAEDGGGGTPAGDRRAPEARRLAEERRQEVVENYAEEKRQVERRKTPDQRKKERRSQERLRQDEVKKWNEKADVEKARGNDELAAAYREQAEIVRRQAVPESGSWTDDPNLGRGEPGSELSPEEFAKWDAEMEAMSQASGRTKAGPETVTRDYVYPKDSPVAAAHRQLEAADAKLEEVIRDSAPKQKGNVLEETMRRMKEVDTRARRVASAQKRVTAAQRAVGKAQKATETGRGQVRTLENAMTRMEKAMNNLRRRQAEAADAGTRLESPSNRNIVAQEKRVARARQRAADRKAAFDEAFEKNPPANMIPMLERIAKNKLIGRVEMQPWALDAEGRPIVNDGGTTAGYVDDAVSQIERSDLYQVVTPEEWQQLRREVMETWQEVADQGYHPVWSHNVDVQRAGYVPTVRPLPARNVRVSQVRERVGDLTPKIEDIAVSMSHATAEYVRAAATKRYMEMFLTPRTKAWGEIRDFLSDEVELMRRKGQIPRGVDEAGALQIALNKHFVEWHPDAIFETQRPKLTGTATVGETKTYLPRNLAKITEDLIAPPSQSGFVRGAAQTSKLYKTSIMAFSMKHMAHILFGGTVFLGLRGGLGEIFNLPKAIKMVREGTMPMEIGRHADIWDSPDQMFQFAAGSKLGKLYEQSLGRFANAKQRFDEFVINVQRADAFLSESGRATKKGASVAEAHEAGVNHVYKTLVDIEGMNPMERNVLRQVMPFYAFMRHTIKYILTYPVDHPMRAAILSRISEIEQADWDSGLPDAMQTLFFLGSPNAHGDITGVEMRQFNPFRDTGSYFTLAGFMKSIHPAAQIPLTIAGMDKFTGSAELYPEVEYDPQTGNLKAKRPPNSAWTAATTLVPELGLIDYFGGVTQEMRELKASNPEAYKKRLYAMLFIPFEPKTVNKAVEVSDMQQNLLKIAQQDVSNATRTGQTGQISRYPQIPYQGELVQPEALTNVINYIKQIRPDVAPRSALPPVELSRL